MHHGATGSTPWQHLRERTLIRRISQLLLWLIPLPFLTSAYASGKLQRYIVAGVLQGGLIAAAAWVLANQRRNRSIVTGRPESLVAASLLVANWAVTSLALNMEAPPRGAAWLASLFDQQLRYYALVAGGLIALAGLALLAARLHDAGERALPILAFTAAVVSQLLFTILFLVLPHATTARFNHEVQYGAAAGWWATFGAAFSSMQVVQRVLMYLAMILYAVSSRRAALMGRRAMACLVSLTALMALANLAVHIPPAVPLVLPYLAGVLLLSGSGAEQSTQSRTTD